MITMIVGTNRPGSNTRKVSNIVREIYQKLGADLKEVDLAKLPPEIFDPGCYAEKPASFKPMSDSILKADGVVLITPEYNGGIPGVLKYFIDMLKFPESFENRPICFIGLAAGRWGALRPVEQLQQIFIYRYAHVFSQRVFLPEINSLLDDTGKLKDPELHQRLTDQAKGFLDFVEKLRG